MVLFQMNYWNKMIFLTSLSKAYVVNKLHAWGLHAWGLNTQHDEDAIFDTCFIRVANVFKLENPDKTVELFSKFILIESKY